MDLVICNNGKATTTSLKVAEYFGKRHGDVIRSIENLMQDQDIFNRRNFALVDYNDAKGESRPMYELDRDGFTLLAMGFTGKQALQFKLSYIDAFNQAEKALTASPALPTSSIDLMRLALSAIEETNQKANTAHTQSIQASHLAQTANDKVDEFIENRILEPWQKHNIQKAVSHKVEVWKEMYPSINVHKAFAAIWRHIKDKFQVSTYTEIKSVKYDQTITMVRNLNLNQLAGL